MSEAPRAFTFGRRLISYRLRRSDRRRTIGIAVDGAGVIVSAPSALEEGHIEAVLRTRAPWILRQLESRKEAEGPRSPHEFVSGEGHLYLGHQYRLSVDADPAPRAGSVLLSGTTLQVRLAKDVARADRPAAVRRLLEAWYRARAREKVPERVQIYAERAGLAPPRVVICQQALRWRSCGPSGVLRFNWQLVMAPLSLIDYVIAHELCHLHVPSHSPAFWRWLGILLPDFAARRERLRRVGASLQGGWVSAPVPVQR